jgi:hypothetical protein
MVAGIRKDIRKALVAGFFRRNVLTRFNDQRIDAEITRRLLPATMRRFADGSGILTPNDTAIATTEAIERTRQSRPYRSRF